MGTPDTQPGCIRLAVFGAGFVFSLRVGLLGIRPLHSLCLYDLEQGAAFAVLREGKTPPFQRLTPSGRAVQAQAGDLQITLQPNPGSLDLYGHAYRFDGDTPLLFDVILTGPERADSVSRVGGLAYRRADGRVIAGSREYLFSPAVSHGILVEWHSSQNAVLAAGLMDTAGLTLTEKAAASASLRRLFRARKLHCSAGFAAYNELTVPYILETVN